MLGECSNKMRRNLSVSALISGVFIFTLIWSTQVWSATLTVRGNPSSQAFIGQYYSFKPQAQFSDGKPSYTAKFSIANRPRWAVFDSVTGQLSGRPYASDVGTYTNVQISATDGKYRAALTPFNIVARQAPGIAATGTAELGWLPPLSHTDGSPFLNLAAYRIYKEQRPGVFVPYLLIGPGHTRYVIGQLPPGLHVFAIATLSSSGSESALSRAVGKWVQ
jgi:hypothetical protein